MTPASPTNPRQQVRDLIAENEGKRRNGPASDGRGWYRTQADKEECYAVADAVMELFPEVELIHEGRYADGSWPQRAYEFPNYIDPTHTRYELRTAPEPIRDAR